MKRLAMLIAATAACVMFTACPDKPTDEFNEVEEETTDGYYVENITYAMSGDDYSDSAQYRSFTQEFTLKDGKMIYDPCAESNQRNGYIDFAYYCDLGVMPFVQVNGDSVVYDVQLKMPWLNMWGRTFTGVIQKTKNGFAFSYAYGEASAYSYHLEVIHDCHHIKSLSD